MKRLLILAMLILTAFLLIACEQDGELRIRNRTASDVWVSIDSSEPRHIEAWSNWSTYYPLKRNLTVSYNGNYVFANSVMKDVLPNNVTTYDIMPDGGAIQIVNDETGILSEVYISPHGDPQWGDDDLTGVLAPNESLLWTVTEGSWDIKVVDTDLVTHYLYDQQVTENQTLSLLYSLFSKSGNKVFVNDMNIPPGKRSEHRF